MHSLDRGAQTAMGRTSPSQKYKTSGIWGWFYFIKWYLWFTLAFDIGKTECDYFNEAWWVICCVANRGKQEVLQSLVAVQHCCFI